MTERPTPNVMSGKKSIVEDETINGLANLMTVGFGILILICSFILCSGITAGIAYRIFIWISGIGY